MEIEKPKGISSQLAMYVEDIDRLRRLGYTWAQIISFIIVIDKPLGLRLYERTIGIYHIQAKKKLANGTLIVEQESLTKGKRGPKPKIAQPCFGTDQPITTGEPSHESTQQASVIDPLVSHPVAEVRVAIPISPPAKPSINIDDVKPVAATNKAKPSTDVPSTTSIVEQLKSNVKAPLSSMLPVLTKQTSDKPAGSEGHKTNHYSINLDD